ncbi:MAG TPA: hypothetical protein VII59_11825 [Streptosporangiaceae bacterium]|jgi:hypothetical protein
MPRRAHSPSTALNSVLLDVLCGQARTLGKFKVLELVAGVPYLSWERVAHIAITHIHRRPGMPGASRTRSLTATLSRTTSCGTCSSSKS